MSSATPWASSTANEGGGVPNVAVPSDRDAIEFTVMSYRSYVGGPSSGGYTYGP